MLLYKENYEIWVSIIFHPSFKLWMNSEVDIMPLLRDCLLDIFSKWLQVVSTAKVTTICLAWIFSFPCYKPGNTGNDCNEEVSCWILSVYSVKNPHNLLWIFLWSFNSKVFIMLVTDYRTLGTADFLKKEMASYNLLLRWKDCICLLAEKVHVHQISYTRSPKAFLIIYIYVLYSWATGHI